MLETLNPQPQDKILALIAMFRDDPRTTKIDLGVGVYKDATGLTPVMRAVKAAEKKLWEVETTKTYTGLAGEPAYNAALVTMILGEGYADRATSVATPGGTGAIRQALELIRMANPKARVWMSAPTWPNHPSIVKYLGMTGVEYRYFDTATSGIDFAGLMADLEGVAAGDAVLLSGVLYTARDAAHKRLFSLLQSQEPGSLPAAWPLPAPCARPPRRRCRLVHLRWVRLQRPPSATPPGLPRAWPRRCCGW